MTNTKQSRSGGSWKEALMGAAFLTIFMMSFYKLSSLFTVSNYKFSADNQLSNVSSKISSVVFGDARKIGQQFGLFSSPEISVFDTVKADNKTRNLNTTVFASVLNLSISSYVAQNSQPADIRIAENETKSNSDWLPAVLRPRTKRRPGDSLIRKAELLPIVTTATDNSKRGNYRGSVTDTLKSLFSRKGM